MNTQTDYINGGPLNTLVKLAIANGVKVSAGQRLMVAAHDAMPRGVIYTEAEVNAKCAEIEAWADANCKGWREDENLDLYGVPMPSDRPKRMSAYDRKHSTRP